MNLMKDWQKLEKKVLKLIRYNKADNSYNGAAAFFSHYNSHHGVGKSSFYPSQNSLAGEDYYMFGK